MTHLIREELRELKELAVRALRSTGSECWELQTSNSFRRIGARGDGDVLCGTKHPIDHHPDLLAQPVILDYVVAAQPLVVIELIEELERLLAVEDAP